MDFKEFAEETARETFKRAVNKPITHWQVWDAPQWRQMVVASCGQRVVAREIVSRGAMPTCPTCRGAFDAYNNDVEI